MDRLREIDPQIKVVLSSGALTEADEKNVINKGFNGFIKKPYNINTLSEKMAEIVNWKYKKLNLFVMRISPKRDIGDIISDISNITTFL